MKAELRSIPMGDSAAHLGATIILPTASKGKERYELRSAEFVDGRMILGLNAVGVRVPVGQLVRLWSAKTKMDHTRCCGCNKHRDHKSITVPAGELGGYLGWFAFLEGGTSPGPHRLLSLSIDGGDALIEFSAEEAIGDISHRVTVEVPLALAA